MTVFADSSALVTLYADEPGHERVRTFGRFVVAQIARVEVPAALWRKHRMGELSTSAVGVLLRQFEFDWFGGAEEPRRFDVVRATSLVYEDAARLTGVHGLRVYDAVQLASACAVRQADPSITRFAAFDHRLRDAAVAEGLVAVP